MAGQNLSSKKKGSRTLLLFLVLICFSTQSTQGGEKEGSQPFRLKVVSLPRLSFAPLYLSEEEGFFKEQGLQIEFVRMGEAVQAIPALIRGDLHVMGETIFPNYLNAIARGARIRIVADKGHLSATGCTYAGLAVRRALITEGKLNTVAQLKGLRVSGIQPSSIPMYYLEKILERASLTIADVEIVLLPTSARLEALERGAIDLVNATEPWLTRIQQAGYAVLWKPVQEIVPDFQHAVVLYGPTLLEKNPEAGKRFMVAYLRGVRQFQQGKTERNLQILSKHMDLDQELLKKCCWPGFHPHGRINVRSLMDYQSWAIRKGFLDRELPPQLFWDPSFIEHANRVLANEKQGKKDG